MLYLLLLVSLAIVSGETNPLESLFSWKQIDWNYPNDSMRQSYMGSEGFSPQNNIPIGLSVWNDKLFVTVPRWRKGIPATLNYINLTEANANNDKSPRLTPYPDWETNDIHSAEGIIDILRPRVDACDRLWAVDRGMSGGIVIRPPRLIAIDLNTNKIVVNYTFKDSVFKPKPLFVDSAVDVDPNNCNDAYVYSSDLNERSLVVYSLAKNDSWKIEHNYFSHDLLGGFFNVSGREFQWDSGLFGLTLSPPCRDGSKTLYFHAMASNTEFSVSTNLIKNQEALAKPDYYKHFNVVGHKGKNSQGTSMALDPETGIIYFNQVMKNAVACWDTSMELNPDTFHIVAQDNTTMIFPNDITLDLKSRKLYVIADDLPTFDYSKYSWNRTNFHIHVASLDDLAEACEALDNAAVTQNQPTDSWWSWWWSWIFG